MQHVISNQKVPLTAHRSYETGHSTTFNFIHKFMAWCDAQENSRFLWLGIAFMGGICTVLPLTLTAIVFIGGNDLALWITACVFNVPILVLNLAALPTKYTLPVLFFAWMVNVAIIAYCLIHFFA